MCRKHEFDLRLPCLYGLLFLIQADLFKLDLLRISRTKQFCFAMESFVNLSKTLSKYLEYLVTEVLREDLLLEKGMILGIGRSMSPHPHPLMYMSSFSDVNNEAPRHWQNEIPIMIYISINHNIMLIRK